MLHFMHPAWLFALPSLLLVALVLLQGATRERKDLEGYAQRGALAKMGLWPQGNPGAMRGLLLAAALGCGLVALAEPRWGGSGGSMQGAQDGSLVVVLDVSRSMLAQDMGGESRLTSAQRMIQKLLPDLAGWRVGLVGFAGEGQAIVPLTSDVSALQTMLERAQPGQVPGKGSNMEAGIKAAIPLFSRPGRRVALLFSDGEELNGDAANTLAALRDAQVEVDAVGLGTPEGGYIPGHADVWGNPTYMTYRGEKVTSRLMEPSLKRLAGGTGGFYVRAVEGGAGDLASKLGALTSGAQPQPVTKGEEKVGYELFQLPLGLALVLLALEAALGLRGRRRRERRFRDELRAALQRPATAMLLFAIAATQSGWTWYPSWLPNREAGQAFAAGDYQRAGDLLDNALAHDPDNFGLYYNRANVYFQQKRYQDATVAYKRALELADAGAKPVIGYNLGNAYFREAEAGKGAAGYKQAIAEYERVLKARPSDADAKHNLEVAKRRLKQAPKQQQSGGQQGGQQNPGQQGAGQQKMPVGVNQTYKPPQPAKNLPSEGEVDTLLKALESDERQRQQEQGASEPSEEANGGPYAQQLLDQALGTLDLQKDW